MGFGNTGVEISTNPRLLFAFAKLLDNYPELLVEVSMWH